MRPGRLFRDVTDFLSLLLRSGIALATTNVVMLPGSAGRRRITWATNSSVPPNLFRIDSPTIAEYQGWVDSQGYSAMLQDGSIIQISYDFHNSDLVGHRLLYFPCPFDLDLELLDTLTLSELIDLYLGEGSDKVRLRSPVRFDFDPVAHSRNHPASHMTFQWSHSRIPVKSPVSFGHFVQFVFQNFYPHLWDAHEFLNMWPRDELEATITSEERRTLHISSFARA